MSDEMFNDLAKEINASIESMSAEAYATYLMRKSNLDTLTEGMTADEKIAYLVFAHIVSALMADCRLDRPNSELTSKLEGITLGQLHQYLKPEYALMLDRAVENADK